MLSAWGYFLAIGAAILINLALLWIWRRHSRGFLSFPKPRGRLRTHPAFTSREGLLLTLALLAAAVPSALVFFDRWLSPPLQAQYFVGPWCAIDFLCQLRFPPYFVYVFLIIPALALLVRTRQAPMSGLFRDFPARDRAPEAARTPDHRQRWIATTLIALSGVGLLALAARAWLAGGPPGLEYAFLGGAFALGWWLRDTPLDTCWHSRAARWLRFDLLLIHVLLVAAIAAFYTRPALAWIPALLLLLSLFILRRTGRPAPRIYWIVSLALVLYSLYLDAWWFAVIGDEYEFYYFSRSIAADFNWTTIRGRFFDGQGVYGTHPFLTSLIQAISLRLFGANVFGWRFSSLYLSALALFFFFKFFSAFVQPRLAYLAVFLLAVSHYLMAFGKIGYNNLQAFFILALSLAAAAWAVQSRKTSAFILLGGALGLCFYSYPGALYALAPVGCLLLFYLPPVSSFAGKRWAALALSLVIWGFPLALQPGYWRAKLPGTLFAQAELVKTLGRAAGHLASNLVYSFFSPVYIPEESHFVSISYVDLITALLFFIGALSLLWQVRRQRAAAYLAASYVLMLVLVGATHDRPTPSTTRMFLLLPWIALLAALGLAWLREQALTAGLVTPGSRWIIPFVLITILGINVYQAYPLARLRMVRYQSVQALFLKVAQQIKANGPMTPADFLIASDPATWNSGDLREMLKLHLIPPETIRITDLFPTGETLTAPEVQALQESTSYVVLNPNLNPAWRRSAGDWLSVQGKTSCEVRDGLGQTGFRIWYLPGMRDICS